MRALWWRPPRSSPNSRTVPVSGIVMFMIMRIEVVLPAPLGPSSPYTAPFGTVSERSVTAMWPENVLLIPRTSRTGSVMPAKLLRRHRLRSTRQRRVQRVPREIRALDSGRKLPHAGECSELAERPGIGDRPIAGDHVAEFVEE